MHHVPYTHKLHSGKTVIQHIYDSHYEGAAGRRGLRARLEVARGPIDERRYQEVLAQLEYQAGQAQVWRDAVNNWFHRASGIDDAKGRAGNHPGRIEAEAMQARTATRQSTSRRGKPPRAARPSLARRARCSATLAYSTGPPAGT